MGNKVHPESNGKKAKNRVDLDLISTLEEHIELEEPATILEGI